MRMGLVGGQKGHGSTPEGHQSTQRAALGTASAPEAPEGHKEATSEIGPGHSKKKNAIGTKDLKKKTERKERKKQRKRKRKQLQISYF